MGLIATLTLNPSLDETTSVDKVRPTDKLRCGALRHDPGGGGINVARVVHELGGETQAIFPGSGPAAQMIDTLLKQQGVPFTLIPIEQQTRQSFTVDETSTGDQFRFVLPGPRLRAEEYQACLDHVSGLPQRPEILVLSGSLPTGTTPDLPRAVCNLCKQLGAKLIVDMSGPLLHEISGAFLIKPNLAELEDWVGYPLENDRSIVEGARSMIDAGRTEAVIVSLGARGAFLVTASQEQQFDAIKVPVASAVGAGDSMVGGIALGIVQGRTLIDALQMGMAAGAAALLTPGTQLARRADFERLLALAAGG